MQHLLLPVNIQFSKIIDSRAIGTGWTCPAPTNVSINLVGLGRVELPTSPLSGVRSNQLSYRPQSSSKLVELVGIEPATS